MRLLVFLLPVSAAAQIVCALGPGAASYKASEDQRPARDAMLLAARVSTAEKAICASNCPEIALYRNATAPNSALVLTSGQAKLVYAPQFFADVYMGFGDAGIMAVMAHEVGHALDDTLGAAWIDKRWTPELRADAWAGCTLAKSNLSPPEMHAALGALAKYPSPKHPAWNLRLPAIRSGYSHCGGAASNVR
ncbi:MAG TPA: hypothetical protein VMH80_17475 [Bryobacteraceae bacterium]|nr:hypothetical protein [Bryobacteraceae bacterium]